jgi:hypothetical protein
MRTSAPRHGRHQTFREIELPGNFPINAVVRFESVHRTGVFFADSNYQKLTQAHTCHIYFRLNEVFD